MLLEHNFKYQGVSCELKHLCEQMAVQDTESQREVFLGNGERVFFSSKEVILTH